MWNNSNVSRQFIFNGRRINAPTLDRNRKGEKKNQQIIQRIWKDIHQMVWYIIYNSISFQASRS